MHFKNVLGATVLISTLIPSALAAQPAIASGFNSQEKKQLEDAHKDAMELATYVMDSPDWEFNEIYKKYFSTRDRQRVKAVFRRILDNVSGSNGHALLGKITLSEDFMDPNDGKWACDGDTLAETRGVNAANPLTIVCRPTGFSHGGIGKGYTNVKKVECDSFGDRVSWKMETLGSILLHEYTHYTNLIARPGGPLVKETDDHASGPYKCQQLSGPKAVLNADSYSWFATEIMWSRICHRVYLPSVKEDDDDPY